MLLLVVDFTAFAPQTAVRGAESDGDGPTVAGWAALRRILPAHPRMLFMGAHPDDGTAVAGLLARLAARGRLWRIGPAAGENLDTRDRSPQSSSSRPRGGDHEP